MSHRHRAEWRRGQRLLTLAATAVLLYVALQAWFELLNLGRP